MKQEWLERLAGKPCARSTGRLLTDPESLIPVFPLQQPPPRAEAGRCCALVGWFGSQRLAVALSSLVWWGKGGRGLLSLFPSLWLDPNHKRCYI